MKHAAAQLGRRILRQKVASQAPRPARGRDVTGGSSGAAGGDRLPRRKAFWVYPAARALIARHTWPLVAGMARSRTPSGASASTSAFMTAAGAPIVPASPQPLAPSGLCAHSVA